MRTISRPHGYVPRGQKWHGKDNRNMCGQVNAISALLTGGLLTVALTDANVDGENFQYVTSERFGPQTAARLRSCDG